MLCCPIVTKKGISLCLFEAKDLNLVYAAIVLDAFFSGLSALVNRKYLEPLLTRASNSCYHIQRMR